VLNVVDILNKLSVPAGKKRINHFQEFNNKIYISTDFGIVVYDLSRLAFEDTYSIGTNGANIEILQTTINNDFIYAVAKDLGIMRANIKNTNLIDFNQWTLYAAGNWNSVEKIGSEIIAVNNDNTVSKFVNDLPVQFSALPQAAVDTRNSNGNLVITTTNNIFVFNDQLTETTRISDLQNLNAAFTCAIVNNNQLFVGTNGKGLISIVLNNLASYTTISPNGPDRNKIFAIQTFKKGLWAVYGDYNERYNPYPLDELGVSKFGTNKEWVTFPYENLLGAKSISRIIVNPKNENEVFFSSNFSGLLKLENDIPTILFNNLNSSMQGIKYLVNSVLINDIRTNGTGFDKKNGNLWVTNSVTENLLHVLKPDGQWQGYNLGCVQSSEINSLGRLTIDKNGTKWICTNQNGLIGFNENNNNKCIAISEEENLPSSDVRSVAVDNKNKLWIGTRSGLRIVNNVDSFLTQNQIKTTAIIIEEEGLGQELLDQQFITDIVVDGANNKWIGTAGAGVFYISSDGSKTFNIFTKDNSPIPNNIINDIDINIATGEVFIATDTGMVSFKGTATSGAEDLSNVVVFPNPVRPDFTGQVNVTGLMNKSNVKITDIEGNLVHEAVSEGGTVLWDTTAFGKYKVASGVYMVFATSEDGAETKVKKVMVVR
jgi:hypothetical protein